MKDTPLMKDGLDKSAIKRIARALQELVPDFEQVNFIKEALKGLDKLELKQRVDHVISVMSNYLPSDFKESAKILSALPMHWDRGDKNDPFRGFAAWPVIDYVGVYGTDHPKLGLNVLKKLTPLFSAEFAIRPFVDRHQDKTLAVLESWLSHKDEHVRRLISEGTRPRLPWGRQLKAFIADPNPVLPLLEVLKLDSSLYVRRSVANHINDISKDHPEKVISLSKKWKSESKNLDEQKASELQWVIRHGLRTLVKQGHPETFPLLGYSIKPKVRLGGIALKQGDIRVGESLGFEFNITGLANKQKCVIDYLIYFKKANGSLASKVFKLKNTELQKGQILTIQKKHSFKLISTRQYYAGGHILAIQVNGKEQQRVPFDLEL